jgi:hypothetical protein
MHALIPVVAAIPSFKVADCARSSPLLASFAPRDPSPEVLLWRKLIHRSRRRVAAVPAISLFGERLVTYIS